jgi:hypothetical protein
MAIESMKVAFKKGATDEVRQRERVLLATCDISRSPAAVIKPKLTWGQSETLRTHNFYLFVLGRGCLDKVPSGGRLITMQERANLSGVVYDSLDGLSGCQKCEGLGNMIPVNLAGLALEPTMHAWSKFERVVIGFSLYSLLPKSSVQGTFDVMDAD